jgi:hypothetical protein
LKQFITNRAEAPKSFGDLPDILQLKIFEMARVPGPLLETWEADVRTPVVLRAVCRRWKRLIDFANDPTYYPEYSYFVDAQLKDIGGPNEIKSGRITIDSLRREFLEW